MKFKILFIGVVFWAVGLINLVVLGTDTKYEHISELSYGAFDLCMVIVLFLILKELLVYVKNKDAEIKDEQSN